MIKYFIDEQLYKKLCNNRSDKSYYKLINKDNIGVTNKKGNTLLFAKSCSSKERIDYLLSLGLELNKKNNIGENALFDSLNSEKISDLLDLGIEYNIQNIYNKNFIENIIYLLLYAPYSNYNFYSTFDEVFEKFEPIINCCINKIKLDITDLYERIVYSSYHNCDNIALILIKKGAKETKYRFLDQSYYSFFHFLEYIKFLFQKGISDQDLEKILSSKFKTNHTTSLNYFISYLLKNFDEEKYSYELIDFIFKKIYKNEKIEFKTLFNNRFVCYYDRFFYINNIDTNDTNDDLQFKQYKNKKNKNKVIDKKEIFENHKRKFLNYLKIKSYIIKSITIEDLMEECSLFSEEYQKLFNFYKYEKYLNKLDTLTYKDVVIGDDDLLHYICTFRDPTEILKSFEDLLLNKKNAKYEKLIPWIYKFINNYFKCDYFYNRIDLLSCIFNKHFYLLKDQNDNTNSSKFINLTSPFLQPQELFKISEIKLYKILINKTITKKYIRHLKEKIEKLDSFIKKTEETIFSDNSYLYPIFYNYINEYIRVKVDKCLPNDNYIYFSPPRTRNIYFSSTRATNNDFNKKLLQIKFENPNLINDVLNLFKKGGFIPKNKKEFKDVMLYKENYYLYDFVVYIIKKYPEHNKITSFNLEYLELFDNTEFSSILEKHVLSKECLPLSTKNNHSSGINLKKLLSKI